MPFDYYARLDRKSQQTYQSSDRIDRVTLGDPGRLHPLVEGLADALSTGKRARVEPAARALTDELTRQLGIPRARLAVRSRRPLERDGSELYGQCSWEADDQPPLIEIWMRTHHRMQVVAFKTFLRTLLHELCHHLDYALHGLDDTFHTEGFFKRESSLMRQLVPASQEAARGPASQKVARGPAQEPPREPAQKPPPATPPAGSPPSADTSGPSPGEQPTPAPRAGDQLRLPW